MLYLMIGGGVGAILFLTVLIAMAFRIVVPTNMVHIVQSAKHTTSYGRGKETGNTYYKWPSWIPRFGVVVSAFPESVFQIGLKDYEAYDQGRLPFLVDVRAFFRVDDSLTAAQRVSAFADLEAQLTAVLQGAVRRVLANQHLENIMQDRSTLGKLFTEEVDEQLKEWGVTNVKVIEFMDIRDTSQSQVIHNIMAKEQSRIAQESRVAVATNNRIAELAEIDARQIADVQKQKAEQLVGLRTAEKNKEVGIAQEQANQEVQAQAKVTAERSMEVARVNTIKQTEINKDQAVINAEASALVQVKNAEGSAQAKVKEAEGQLAATLKNAEGISATGAAQGAAEQAKLMAPVNAQIALAEKIGADEGYQKYLITIKQVEVGGEVGKAMAASLEKADLKVIANSGNVQEGVSGLTSILTPGGGTNIAGMLTALAQTDEGKQVLDAVAGKVAAVAAPKPKKAA
jgi:flotillin